MQADASLYQGMVDIHNSKEKYERALKRFKEDKKICKENRDIASKFLEDCRLGKTLQNTKHKQLGWKRLNRLVDMLKNFCYWLNKPFSKLTQDNLDKFIDNLENNKFKQKNGKNYSEGSKLYYKKGFNKFNKWLKKNNINNKLDFSSVEMWEDNDKDGETISKEEVEKMIEKTGSVRNKALLMTLFDAGCRIEEALNVQLKNLKKEDDLYSMEIRQVRKSTKTKERTITLPLATSYLDKWFSEHPDNKNPEAHLWLGNFTDDTGTHVQLISYGTISQTIKRLGEKALGRKIHAHVFRHGSMDYWCEFLEFADMCYRFGHSFSSKMLQTYLTRKKAKERERAVATKTKLNIIEGYKQQIKTLQESGNISKAKLTNVRKEIATLKHDVLAILETFAKTEKQRKRLEEMSAFSRKG